MKRLLIISAFLVSCRADTNNLSKANDYFIEYLLSHEKAYLDSSYESLKSAEYLDGDNLNHQNAHLITSVLLYMKKYDELGLLLQESDKLERYKKDFTLNLALGLKTYNEDSVVAIGYILENLKMAKNEIVSNPHDSTLWINYFAMRLYLVEKELVLNEVDSLKSINRNFTNIFYENILVDFIEEYPNELMFK